MMKGGNKMPEESDAFNKLGTLLKSLLKQQSLSMRKLSALTGMDTATISRIVNGKQQAKLTHLQKFSDSLNVPMEDLVKAAGFNMSESEKNNQQNINNPVNHIQEALASSKLIDKNFNTAHIEQELDKYEQYAQTEEGHRQICEMFETKIEQVSGIGPYIDELKQMYQQYLDDNMLPKKRAILGSALLYFILSADIIPDYVFPIGYLDDVIAIQIVQKRLAE